MVSPTALHNRIVKPPQPTDEPKTFDELDMEDEIDLEEILKEMGLDHAGLWFDEEVAKEYVELFEKE